LQWPDTTGLKTPAEKPDADMVVILVVEEEGAEVAVEDEHHDHAVEAGSAEVCQDLQVLQKEVVQDRFLKRIQDHVHDLEVASEMRCKAEFCD